MKCKPEREILPLQPMPAKTVYPAFVQDSGPLQVNNQRPYRHPAENRNVCFYSLLDGR